MGKLAKFPNKSEREDFFRQLQDLLPEKLPINPDDLDIRYPGGNWIVLKYLLYPSAQYELQFSTIHSEQHTDIFGEGDHEVLAFYYGGSRIEKRRAWLQTIEPYIASVRSQLGKKVFHGGWGKKKDWAFIAVDLIEDDLGFDVDRYVCAIVEFIETTHDPISKAFQTIT